MPQSNDILDKAKAVAASADKAFPSKFAKIATGTTAAPVAAPKPTVAPAPAVNLGTELAAKKTMIDKAAVTTPKMHSGGSVKADGDYNLKAGEHVLTEPEAKLARKHALMFSGMKSLAHASKG